MSDDNIYLFHNGSEETLLPKVGDSFQKRSQENHFYLETFLSYNDADGFIKDNLAKYDMEEFYVGMIEIRNINGGYQAGLSIFKKQGELF